MDTIIAGLQLGDEAKGSTVDYLAGDDSLVVRYNGGPQAAHHVVTPEGITHCFSQFGSNTLRQGSTTYLSLFTLVNPLNILAENDALISKGIPDALSRLYLDENCPIVTPFNVLINRMLEIANYHQKGSCGMGVGDTMRDLDHAVFVKDFFSPAILRHKLNTLWLEKLDLAEQLVSENPQNFQLATLFAQLSRTDYVTRLASEYQAFANESGVHIVDKLPKPFSENVIFEGAQGVLLDPTFGFTPFVTQTRTTFVNADFLQENIFTGQVKRLGIVRAYQTRHGPGPFPSEDPLLQYLISDIHNTYNDWQREFRLGWFDLILAKYARDISGNKIDGLVVTNVDRLNYFHHVKVCVGYTLNCPPDNLENFFDCIREGSQVIITAIKVLDSPDIKHQRELTKLLTRCLPVYQDLPGWESEGDKNLTRYLEFLQKELNIPIEIVSFGPTRTEKKSIQ